MASVLGLVGGMAGGKSGKIGNEGAVTGETRVAPGPIWLAMVCP